MTNADLQHALQTEHANALAHEAIGRSVAATHAPFWFGIAATALRILRPLLRLSGAQSAAYDIVESLVAGGGAT